MMTGVSTGKAKAAKAEVLADPSLIPDHHLDYDDWLDWTGRDDSFVGNEGASGPVIPGTQDLYAAAMHELEIITLKNESSIIWESGDDDETLITACGRFEARTDPVYGYYSLRATDDPEISIMESDRLSELNAEIRRLLKEKDLPSPDI